jgi:palmitoyltransferase
MYILSIISQLHRILKITDAYRSRVFHLSEAIRTNLVEKRDKIIAQLHRLEYRVEEIRFVKNIIARDIRSEYAGISERLKN